MLTCFLLFALGASLDQNKVVNLEIKADLRLGGGEEDYEIFSDQAGVIADKAGTIFIMDPGNQRVVVFDREGSYVRSFGRAGEGPGEFGLLAGIALDHQNRLVVFDSNRSIMSRFQKDGTYIDQVSMEQGIRAVWTPVFLSDGRSLIGTVKTDAQFQMSYHLGLYDKELKMLKTYAVIALPQVDWSQANDPKFWVNFLKINMEQVAQGVPLVISFDDDSFMTAETNRYEGHFYDRQLAAQGTFQRKIKPKANLPANKKAANERLWQNMIANPFLAQRLTKPVFEEAYRKAELSDYLLPIAALIRLGDGFATIAQYDVARREGNLEVFSRNGELRGQATYRGPIDQVTGIGDTIYAIGPNEDDEINMIRFRVHGL